jgi:hypothetical protein
MRNQYLDKINNLDDHKFRKTLSISIVEEVFTKKPYGKHLAIMMLSRPEMNGNLMSRGFDLAKCARECLKNLTSEELKQLAILDPEGMPLYEKRFISTEGTTL